jgi:glycosyltransferase involved in cell wall biosynthesis
MNILLPYMARWKSANWTRYHHLFTLLAQKGHTIHVFQPPPMASQETNFQDLDINIPQNIHLHDVHMPSFIWNYKYPLEKLIKKGLFCLYLNPVVKKAVKEYNIDAVLIYNLPQFYLTKLKSCITIFDYADDLIAMLKHELCFLSNKFILHFAYNIMKKMMTNANLLFVTSYILQKQIELPSYVLPNGVNMDKSVINIGQEYKQMYKHPIIGFIGAFEYFIDFDLIIDTAEILKDKTFLLVGGGREFNNVKRKIEEKKLDNIILVGSKPHNEVLKYIDAMDICLNIFKRIPISHGACPIKLFEYLAFKKPVISTSVEEVKIINTGFLYFADNSKELADNINNILNNPSDLKQKVEIGYNLVSDKYTWDKIADQFLDILNEYKLKK